MTQPTERGREALDELRTAERQLTLAQDARDEAVMNGAGELYREARELIDVAQRRFDEALARWMRYDVR